MMRRSLSWRLFHLLREAAVCHKLHQRLPIQTLAVFGVICEADGKPINAGAQPPLARGPGPNSTLRPPSTQWSNVDYVPHGWLEKILDDVAVCGLSMYARLRSPALNELGAIRNGCPS